MCVWACATKSCCMREKDSTRLDSSGEKPLSSEIKAIRAGGDSCESDINLDAAAKHSNTKFHNIAKRNEALYKSPSQKCRRLTMTSASQRSLNGERSAVGVQRDMGNNRCWLQHVTANKKLLHISLCCHCLHAASWESDTNWFRQFSTTISWLVNWTWVDSRL